VGGNLADGVSRELPADDSFSLWSLSSGDTTPLQEWNKKEKVEQREKLNSWGWVCFARSRGVQREKLSSVASSFGT